MGNIGECPKNATSSKLNSRGSVSEDRWLRRQRFCAKEEQFLSETPAFSVKNVGISTHTYRLQFRAAL